MKRTILALLVLAALSLAVPAGAAAAPPPFFTEFGKNSGSGGGSAAGETEVPRDMAVDPATGNIYVADQGNQRISEFSPWGVFLRAWGWGVEDGSAELQTCTPAHCQSGLLGSGLGQFNHPVGIAIDSAGYVYVADRSSFRVQKFDPTAGPSGGEVAFLLSFGEKGTGDGQFSGWEFGSYLDIGPGDKIYVGDAGRIQRFDTAGAHVENIPLPGEQVQALAVDPASGNLYVSYLGGQFEPFKPDVRKLSPTGAPLATLNVASPRALATDPDGNVYVVDGEKTLSKEPRVRKFTANGEEVPDFAFTDGIEASTGIATGSGCGIPGVNLFVSNMRFDNSYVRAYGPTPDPDVCPPPQVAPTISSQFVTSVGSDGATVKAKISPNYWADTTYLVQYGIGKCSEGGCTQERPLPPGSTLTSGVTNQALTTAGVFLDGLQPNTAYHYRFVAQSSGGGPVRGVGGVVGSDGAEGTFTTFPLPSAPRTDCPNQAFRTGASATLVDCRAYELVSPVDKNGGDVAIEPVVDSYGTLAESSADGNRATFSSLRSFGDPQGAPLVNQYLATRSAGGWTSAPISPPRKTPSLTGVSSKGRFKAFSEDLCSAWVLQDSDVALVPGAPAGVPNLYQRENCGTEPPYGLLSTVVPPGFDPKVEFESFYYPTPLGFSADGSRTVLRAPAELTSNACATAGIYQTYVTSEEGPLRLVSLLPGGNKAACSHTSAGTFFGSPDSYREPSVHHAVSVDGSRIFWTDTGGATPVFSTGSSGGGPGKLYLRLNATEAQSKVSAGQCTEPEKACTLAVSTANDTLFQVADPAGTAALFTTGGELRRYDVATASSQMIATGVLSVVGASEDLSRVYFVSSQVLSDEQANDEGNKAQAGQPNLYLSEGGVETFIATLGATEGKGGERPGLATQFPRLRTSRVSPDGLHLAFTSAASLTGYDNADLVSGKPDLEVFLYDADAGGGAGELRCLSCNPTGARPQGRKLFDLDNGTLQYWAAANLPGWPTSQRPSRLLAADGDRLFFHSFEALVPGDTNGKQDVYEWQRAGSAQDCEQVGAGLYAPEAGGCLSLISSGQSPADSELIDASADGQDIFIATASSLLPQDPGLIDVYDARIGGGFPQPGKGAACEGEACQGPYDPPQDPTPASSSFEGAGNVKDGAARPRCAKPKVKRKGRCVVKKKQKKGESSRQRANKDRRAGR